MNQEYLMLLGIISQMSEEDQKRIKDLKETIINSTKEEGDHGFIALSLAAFELQKDM